MTFHFLTIFPDIFDSYISKGMIRIALKKKAIKIKTHNLRDFAVDKHGTVDDRPYGGGPGQILMVEPVIKALKKIQSTKHKIPARNATHSVAGGQNKHKAQKNRKIILLSAKGKKWTQQMAQKFAKLDEIIFICPRYEGHDERIKKLADAEISIGDYVLTGGELPAMVIADSITRLLPNVLGEPASLKEESHSTSGFLEYPQYTRPEVIKINGRAARVPKVLLSGHHKNISAWRAAKSKNR
jgi:tRNA (guanine37-N1)-methyltransferase